MKETYDVVIVGGGVNGSSAAYFLASNKGFDGSVLVVEKDPTYETAPSARATGGIRQQFSTEENIHIGLFGVQFVKSIEDRLSVEGESTGVLFKEQGYLLLGEPSQRQVLSDNQAIQVREGADIVFKDRAELARDFPWLNTDELECGCFGQSNEGWVDPYSLLMAFRKKARSLGVDYVQDKALEVIREGNSVTGVRLKNGGLIGAGAVINSAGASGVRHIANSVGVELPIESRLRAAFVFECREDLSHCPLTVLPNGVAWRPEGSRFIVNRAPSPENDPERFDFEINHDQFDEDIWPWLARWIPAFEAIKVVHSYSCHYDFNTLDENLIIGRCGDLQNFYVATGFSGHGMQQAPAVGRALSELIVNGEYQTINLDRFGYDRVLAGEPLAETNCW